jgi:hypothetical protein
MQKFVVLGYYNDIKEKWMVSLSEYLSDPCGTLSIPFWKSKKVDLPDDMRVVHKDRFSQSFLRFLRINSISAYIMI